MTDRLTKIQETIVRYNALFVNPKSSPESGVDRLCVGPKPPAYSPDPAALEEFCTGVVTDFPVAPLNDEDRAQVRVIIEKGGRLNPDDENKADINDAALLNTLSDTSLCVLFFFGIIRGRVYGVENTNGFKTFSSAIKYYIFT
jgi:hypothetical protein